MQGGSGGRARCCRCRCRKLLPETSLKLILLNVLLCTLQTASRNHSDCRPSNRRWRVRPQPEQLAQTNWPPMHNYSRRARCIHHSKAGVHLWPISQQLAGDDQFWRTLLGSGTAAAAATTPATADLHAGRARQYPHYSSPAQRSHPVLHLAALHPYEHTPKPESSRSCSSPPCAAGIFEHLLLIVQTRMSSTSLPAIVVCLQDAAGLQRLELHTGAVCHRVITV